MATTDAVNAELAHSYGKELFNSSGRGATITRYDFSDKMAGLYIMLQIEIGARVGDVLNLKWTDIKPSNDSFKFKINWTEEKTKYKMSKFISNVLAKALAETETYVIKHFANEYRKNHNKNISDYIFYNYKSNKKGKENLPDSKVCFTAKWAYDRVKKANEEGQLGRKVAVAGTHSLRKASGQRIYKETGHNLAYAQEFYKHKNLKTTSDYLKPETMGANEVFEKLAHNFD